MTEAENASPKPSRRIKKIVVDRDLCIGAASCVAVAGKVFQLDDENKAVVLDPTGADDETLKLAAQSCPVFAIFLHDKDGRQIYPEENDTTGGQPL